MPIITDVEYDAMSVQEREHIRKKLAETVGLPDCTYEISNEGAFRIHFTQGTTVGRIAFPSKLGEKPTDGYAVLILDDLFQAVSLIPNKDDALANVTIFIKETMLRGIL